MSEARSQCGQSDADLARLLDDQSLKKWEILCASTTLNFLGSTMSSPPSWLSCRGRGVVESHEVSLFLQLHGTDAWIRRTGTEITLHRSLYSSSPCMGVCVYTCMYYIRRLQIKFACLSPHFSS